MVKTASEKKVNVEVLLDNINVTLANRDNTLTPEELIYFKNEQKTLVKEHARLDGVVKELRGQLQRYESKLDKSKQKLPPRTPIPESPALEDLGRTTPDFLMTPQKTDNFQIGTASPYFQAENWTPSKEKMEPSPLPERYSPNLLLSSF